MSHVILKSKNSVPGFSLVEILLYVGIIGVLLLGVSTFFLMTVQARIKSRTITEVEQQGGFVMNLITETIRNGVDITSPATGASGASLSISSGTASTTPTVFDLSGGVLRVTEGASGVPLALTSSRVVVNNFSVQNLTVAGAPASVRVQFTVTGNNVTGQNEYDFTQTFYGSASIRFK